MDEIKYGIFKDDNTQVNIDRVINYADPGTDNTAFKEKLVSAFRLENTVMSLVAEEGGLPDGYADNEYDVFSKLTDQEKGNEDFVRVAALSDNDSELESVRNQYSREMEDRAKLTGVDGVAAGILAGTIDPVNLIPVGGAAGKAYKAGNVLKGGLITGAVAAGSVAASEALLQKSQITRTYGESALNVTGGMLLGGALGSMASSLNKAQLASAAKETEELFDGPISKNITDSSVGAMEVFGDVKIKGKFVRGALKALSPIDPLAKVMTASSKAARKWGALMFENPLIVEGAQGRSVEQIVKTKQDMYFAQGLTPHLEAFTEAKKNGWKGKKREFDELTSREVANPGSTGNKFAERSANNWVDKVYNPIATELQKLGMLGEDLDPKTAMRYLNRRWNKEAVSGRIGEFKKVVASWIRETQPDIDDAEDLAQQIALRIMGSPDGVIRYDEAFKVSGKATKDAPSFNAEDLKGIDVQEKVYIRDTGEFKKVKADAADVYSRLTKQKNVLQKIRGCLGA